jgi:hypothetical protein
MTDANGTKQAFYAPMNVCSWWKSGHAADITAIPNLALNPTDASSRMRLLEINPEIGNQTTARTT